MTQGMMHRIIGKAGLKGEDEIKVREGRSHLNAHLEGSERSICKVDEGNFSSPSEARHYRADVDSE